MALITCAECSNQVSDKAVSCPKCGAPVAAAAPAPAGPPAAEAAPPLAVPVPAAPIQPTPQKKKGGITLGRVLVWLFILAGGFVIYKVKTGSSLVGAVQGPQTIISERVQLKEGAAQAYSITIPTSRRVEVQVHASPRIINVLLMTDAQWTRYRQVKGKLFGGQYQYIPGLSRQGVLDWTGSEVLPAGSWMIVVERPAESLLFGDATNATVKIIGY